MKQLFDVLRLLALGAAAAFGQTKVDATSQVKNLPNANTIVLTGTGNPNGAQTCAPTPRYTVFIDTSNGDVWHCTGASAWKRLLDTSGTGPFAASGTLATAPIAIPVQAGQGTMQFGAATLEYAVGSTISRTVVPRTCAAGSVQTGIAADGTVVCTAVSVTLPVFVDNETPAGAINGTNAVFTLAAAPVPAASLALFRNGILMRSGSDYTLAGAVITYLPGAIPQPGDALAASYRK